MVTIITGEKMLMMNGNNDEENRIKNTSMKMITMFHNTFVSNVTTVNMREKMK